MYDEIISRGAAAEQAYPYIVELVGSGLKTITAHILNLKPNQTALFSAYKANLECLEDLLSTVVHHITAGKEAIDEIQGNKIETTGGIL